MASSEEAARPTTSWPSSCRRLSRPSAIRTSSSTIRILKGWAKLKVESPTQGRACSRRPAEPGCARNDQHSKLRLLGIERHRDGGARSGTCILPGDPGLELARQQVDQRPPEAV